jgi:hypothetical protein
MSKLCPAGQAKLDGPRTNPVLQTGHIQMGSGITTGTVNFTTTGLTRPPKIVRLRAVVNPVCWGSVSPVVVKLTEPCRRYSDLGGLTMMWAPA